jgi:hypothetical protein
MPDTPYKGATLFKLGFGSKPVLLPLPVSITFNPVLRALLYSEKLHKLLKYNGIVFKWLNDLLRG